MTARPATPALCAKAEVHPLAALFPMMPADELQVLAADIKANGLHKPLVVWRDEDGKLWLLDGRNRKAACDLARVKPRYDVHEGDPAAYVVSANLTRRHLSKGQAAMLAARVRFVTKQTARDAAEQFGVPASTIGKASTVIQFRPELVEKVTAGVVPLDEAYAAAQETKAAKAEAHAARCRTLDAAVFLGEEFATYPERAAELVDGYAPSNPASPVTAERLDAAIEGLTRLRKEWPA